MKGKKLFAMLLALVMACSVFAGCSGGGGSSSGSGSSAAEESAAAEESGESGEDSQAEAGSTGEITWEDPYEVVMCYIYFGTLSEDLQMVEDAMHEIALEKTNTQVSLLPLSFSEISTQPSLMISSGEKLDLLLSPAQSDLMNCYNSNMLLELDELVEEYGQDILAAKSDVLDVGRIDGQLYAITGTRQHYNSQGLMGGHGVRREVRPGRQPACGLRRAGRLLCRRQGGGGRQLLSLPYFRHQRDLL